jgi:hypothetical protein
VPREIFPARDGRIAVTGAWLACLAHHRRRPRKDWLTEHDVAVDADELITVLDA